MAQLETLHFSHGHEARLLRVQREDPADEMIAALALPAPNAVICLNGDTAEISQPLRSQLRLALGAGLASVAAEDAVTLVTGGTHAGIFSLLGEELARCGRTAPCLGILPAARVSWPGHAGDDATLEPHHSHFLAVEGEAWGDELETMLAVVGALSRHCPALAVFAGGGKVTLREMRAHVEAGRRLLLLAGSGRSTDAVLAARARGTDSDETVWMIAAHGLISIFPVDENPAALRDLIRTLLAG